MARYQTTLSIPVPIDAAFAYVSDFRHATWDPAVKSATRTDGNGPLGVGSTFVLVSPLPIGSIHFHYRIEVYDPPNHVRLSGKTWFARYTDDLTLTSAGPGGGSATSLTYNARFSLRGPLVLGEPIMQLIFNRVGAAATRGIPAAVEKAQPTRASQ
ncbi:MAG TPA: SRPBCC family protein [Kofleriaceae bacterium]|nr:SRPBCC family protein [Kofleriaceae bacterium]